ncbi:zinc-dependent alcohol dehydrogenase family protein [Mycolicibacterium komossense]|uniref:Zinc-dependent alcohol dehydrogenase family protein n=1 Tax=Mycolicibacterium komossense TaxID=1779 RepID=A0ABT3CFN2_9MYCO|nr:zinc-dependent alcohol dehydrogenase family protein [Mycolicibacterium komossense]MCV7228275.1 zinc-dependent alcohol dehydrogenase family protein [Mycolicibacterium komossense]
MKALVYHGAGYKSWDTVADPQIEAPTDVIVKIDATTICGSDLHILKGDVPAVREGRVLGHEGVGTIVEAGSAVTTLQVGDQVILACIKNCGRCDYCRRGVHSHCAGGEGASGMGWIFGHLINGTQAEYVRVPYAETSAHKLPEGVTPAQGVMLSDILPTGFEIGVLYGRVKPGDAIAVIGAGPVGLAVMTTAGLQGASRVIAVDIDESRARGALDFGATHWVNSSDPDWRDKVLALTGGHGVDVSVEAVGIPATFQMALDIVRPGGNVANVGVHGGSVSLALQDLWIKNINISMGLVNTDTLPMLLRLVADGALNVDKFATHHFELGNILAAYDVFVDAAKTKARKVILHG